MKTVRFYGLDPDTGQNVRKGHVRWDGKRLLISPGMEGILSRPISTPDGEVLTYKDGEAFLDGLPFAYRNAYLNAHQPVETK